MTPKQNKALQALLTSPNKRAAAEAAEIDEKTLRKYLAEPEFQKEYKAAFSELVTDATRQVQQSLNPAISALVDDRFFMLVQVLNRVFKRNNVLFFI